MIRQDQSEPGDIEADGSQKNDAGILMGRVISALLKTKVLDPAIALPKPELTTLALGPGAIKNLRQLIKELLDMLQGRASKSGEVGVTLHMLFLQSQQARDFCLRVQSERERQEVIYIDRNRRHRFVDWIAIISNQTRHLGREALSYDRTTPEDATGQRCAHELYSIAASAQAAFEYMLCKSGKNIIEPETKHERDINND